jgi:hypothetical protein
MKRLAPLNTPKQTPLRTEFELQLNSKEQEERKREVKIYEISLPRAVAKRCQARYNSKRKVPALTRPSRKSRHIE